RMVRGAFSQRRKNLANSLSSSLGMDKSAVTNSIRAAGLSENIRPEQLTLQQLADVSERISEICEVK
ncbi:MAG: 16S rRNA (adenine(1518)-N(6)/adenine(1519)-N(6))-dimethyltransferase, partial [Oscillospiraceae bacterium]|nr:16S rRNA (adenine(1518)-N(6)/adenine(1519)-N(6))-dimethyltransferase [Oscillospiraceae bacterium]